MQNDRYHVHARLGSGTTGSVFRATRPGDGRQVVLKALHAHLLQGFDRDRLAATVATIARVEHPSLPRGLELVTWRGDLVLVREYVRGVDLGTLVAGAGPPRRVALALCGAVAAGLSQVLERSGCWHGDVKPSNVFLDLEGRAVLVDFGLAAALPEQADRTLTMYLGSVGFASPERVDNQPVAASDVYSVGILLAWMVTGRMVPRTSANPTRHAAQQEALLASLRGTGLGDDGIALIEACTRYAPSDRPTMAEVSDRLARMVATSEGPSVASWARPIVEALVVEPQEVEITDVGQPLSATRTAEKPPARASMPPAGKIVTAPHARPRRRWRPPSGWILAIGMAAAALAMMAGAVALSR